jgi:hypothetical protein
MNNYKKVSDYLFCLLNIVSAEAEHVYHQKLSHDYHQGKHMKNLFKTMISCPFHIKLNFSRAL